MKFYLPIIGCDLFFLYCVIFQFGVNLFLLVLVSFGMPLFFLLALLFLIVALIRRTPPAPLCYATLGFHILAALTIITIMRNEWYIDIDFQLRRAQRTAFVN